MNYVIKYKLILMVIAVLIVLPHGSYAHCDGVDGPVVQAAVKSLETGDVNYVLIWVQRSDEDFIKKAFAKTIKVRSLGQEAMEIADHHFLETVVRIHRQGEGEPFTGIKAAGRDLGPVIPAADKSIQTGSIGKLKEIISAAAVEGLEEKFTTLIGKKNFDVSDVTAGREFVKAYVDYLHYADNLYKSAGKGLHESNSCCTEEEVHNH